MTVRRRRILYVAGTVPARSETFVYREVFGLRDAGAQILVASVHAPERDLGDTRLDELAKEAVQIYPPGGLRMARDGGGELLRHPIRTLGNAGRSILDAVTSGLGLSGRLKILWQAGAGVALARRVRSFAPEHVHAHMAHVPTTIAMYCARQLGVPFSFTGHAVDLFRSPTLLKQKIRRAAFVACISLWHRDFYRDFEALPDERLPIVRCGVDPTEFAPSDPGSDPEVSIVTVGRLIEKKGFDVLLRALAKAESKARLRCRIIGGGPEAALLENLAKELGIESCVEFLGPRSNAEVREQLRGSDLFVLPCRVATDGDKDGIPVALMEAMASGVCVVSGDLPAIRELIKDGASGMLVEPGNAEDLASRIDQLSTERELRVRLAAAGRERVEAEFSLQKNVQRILSAFEAAGSDATG